MSRTVAESAAAYRKRRAEKMARYEEALTDLAKPYPSNSWFDLNSKDEAVRMLSRLIHAHHLIAQDALNPTQD